MIGVIIGAILGFLSALGLHEKQRWDARRDDCARSSRLMELIRVEILETRGYLSDRMVMAGKIETLDFVLSDERRLREAWATAEAALKAVTTNHAIFDAYIGMIIDLPDTMPKQLAQFYGDIGPLTNQLRAAHEDNDEHTWEAVRIDFLTRTDTLERALTQMLLAYGRSADGSGTRRQ